MTEEYIAAQLAAVGAKPAGENGTYFQTVPMVGVSDPSRVAAAAVRKAEAANAFKWQDEFVGATHPAIRADRDFEAEAVFVGHGIV